MTLSSHGFLGYAAMSSETLGDAIELAVKFFRTRSTIIQLESFADGDWAVLQVNEMLALGDLAPLVVESLFSSFHFMAMQLIPDVEILGELRFSYPEPPYFARLRPLIPVPVYFDCAYSQMRFPVERLQRRLRFADRGWRRWPPPSASRKWSGSRRRRRCSARCGASCWPARVASRRRRRGLGAAHVVAHPEA